MKISTLLALVATISLSAGSAAAMDVREFLATAAGIPRNPTAMLRSDTRRLLLEISTAMETIRADDKAAQASGRRPATCMPDKVPINDRTLLARFQSIPSSRQNISVTQAMREWMAERYPCPAT